jgi:hypothetical protein
MANVCITGQPEMCSTSQRRRCSSSSGSSIASSPCRWHSLGREAGLVYDFQSERWTESELPKLTLRELRTLTKLLGSLSYGTKETLIVRGTCKDRCFRK